MVQELKVLAERHSALSAEARGFRSKGQVQPDDMLRLAKILSRKAQLEMQLAILGVTITRAEIQTMISDDLCPF